MSSDRWSEHRQFIENHPWPPKRRFRFRPAAVLVAVVAGMVAGVAGAQQTGNKIGRVAAATCTPNATTLCLSGARFRVSAAWRTSTQSGQATAVPLTSDTGYFWFFNASNVEMIVKVLDACSFSAHKWVFAGGLTNVEVTLTVTDTQTGAMKIYVNPANTAFLPIQDTTAFSTCP